jgi:hypothetical protein
MFWGTGLLFLTTVALGAELELGTNLDFEETTQSGLTGWLKGFSGYEIEADPAERTSGRQSLRIRYVDAPVEIAGTFRQTFSALPFHGRRLTLSGFIRTRDIERGHAALWLRVDGHNERMLSLANMRGFGPTGTTGWQQYETGVVVNPEAVTIIFGGLLWGDGVAWFDDFRLSVEPAKIGYNLDFEDNYPRGPKEWSVFPLHNNAFTTELDPINPKSGKLSLRVRATGPAADAMFYLDQSCPAELMRGKLILVRVFIRTENVTGGGAKLVVGDYDLSQKPISTNAFSRVAAQGTSPWTKYESEHFVSPRADWVTFGATFAGNGTVWFDDFHVEILDIP